MDSETDEILDYKPKTDKHIRLIKAMYLLSLVFFAYWYISDLRRWPYTGESLLAGLLILFAITLIRFVSKDRRAPFEFAYFFGKIVLIAAVFMSFMNLPYTKYYIFTSFGFFLLGLILLNFKSKKNEE